MQSSTARVELFQSYNPSNQCAIFEQGDRAFVGNAPTLAQIKREQGVNIGVAWVYAQLVDLCEYTGVRDKMTVAQITQTATLICSTAYYLKLSELMVFFVKLKAGEYGSFYGVVDSMKIMEALQHFLKWRNEKLDQCHRAMRRAKEATDPESIQLTEWVHNGYRVLRERAEEIRAEREQTTNKKSYE